MSSTRKSQQTSGSRALAVKTIFGPPPILPEEDSHAYEELLAQVTAHVKPTSVIEEIWVRDVVDLSWEILRLRRIKTGLVSRGIPKVLTEVVRPFVVYSPVYVEREKSGLPTGTLSEQYVQRWARGEPDAVAWINDLIANKCISMDAVMNSVFIRELRRIEQIDRLTALAESRRNAVLREIERHRSTFAQLLRDKVQDVQDAEFETIEPKSIPQNDTADKKAA